MGFTSIQGNSFSYKFFLLLQLLHTTDHKKLQKDSAVAIFKHHTEPVTTVQWHPSDSSVFASGGEDNQIAIWDLAVERDCELNEEELKVFIQLYLN